jgi:ligand-binding sensor domain-containing protein/signal transduction histidine kinase
LIIIFSIYSCGDKLQAPSITNDSTKAQISKDVVPNKFLPPKIIFIKSENAPQKTIAGKPITRADSLKGGAPFFVNYTTAQGVPSNIMTNSATDKEGNLWFASAGGGVCKYDGKSFTSYNRTQGLAGNVVFSIIEDKGGDLWFGTSAGLSKYDGNNFKTYSTTEGLPSTYVHSLLQDHKGNIWIGTRGRGIIRYDGKSFTSFNTDISYVHCIIEDKKGNLWFGSHSSGVFRYDGSQFFHYTTAQGLAGNYVECIMEDKDGNIWFGTSTGLSKYDGTKFKTYTVLQGLPVNDVSCMLQDKNREFWIGTASGGICRYDGVSFTTYTMAQGLPSNNVSSISEDKKGNIWFTSYGGGITRLLGKSISDYNTSHGLTGGIVFGINEDKNNNIWFATQNAGATRFDGRTFARFTKTQGLSSNNLWFVMSDKSGNIWFGTDNAGASKFDGNNFTNYSTVQGLPNNTVWNMFEDNKGNIWFGTDGGASKFDGNSFSNYTREQGLPGNNVQGITQDRSGNIWFATHDDGVSKFDGKNFTNYSISQGLPSNTVYAITADKNGNVWFGTNNGVSKYDAKNFTSYTTADGLADNSTWDVVEDSARGMIWFSTNFGISGINYDGARNENIPSERFENFNEKTGYPMGNLSRSLCLDKNGVLWTGSGDDRVIRFDYSLVSRNKDSLPLHIQEVQINNKNICWSCLLKKENGNRNADSMALLNGMVMAFGNTLQSKDLDSVRNIYRDIQIQTVGHYYPVPIDLVLPYKFNTISFDFVAIAPDRPNQVKYQYQLEGYNKDWSSLSNNSRAVFGNLPEGNYTFKIKALSTDGIWSQTKYSFKVLPPWQRTWWAYLIFILVFAGIIWAIVSFRSRVLKRENRILEEKVKHRTVQLQESLEELKSTQSQLVQREKMASLGELTAGIAHEIQNPLNFVNNFSDVNTELLREMKTEIDQGNFSEARSIAESVIDNEEKINSHGKRADSIVKGMLQHSRTSTGQREPTDINALADEYLRLAYHGLRAKDSSFNATIKTDFDPSIGKINIVPQDIGRVLLNIFNNAFYAVTPHLTPLPPKVGVKYEPTVRVSTKLLIPPPGGLRRAGAVEIRISDNGSGIPENILDKIFQPFFTTKPPGQGTGLGLSLSYDIIKAHGGEIKVETKENYGTEFIIQLPLK